MAFITRLLLTIISLAGVSVCTFHGAEPPAQTKGSLVNTRRQERKPVHLIVDAKGAVTQVAVLKGITATAAYDERFTNLKGNSVPALDNVMLQALRRWRAKPGLPRVVDIYWSFGAQPWLNYGKPNSAK